jgi:MFS transporter, DHA1 family, inner membrane transport protein
MSISYVESGKSRLLVVTFLVFTVGTQTQLFSGLLPDMAKQFNLPLATVSQLNSLFALVYAIGVPWVASLSSRFSPKSLLWIGLCLLGGINLLAATRLAFTELLWLRILCALLATVVSPVASVVATVMTSHQGLASGIVLLGLTLSFILGVPSASFLGHCFGWQATCVASGISLLIASIVVIVALPQQFNTPMLGNNGLKSLSIIKQIPIPLITTMLGFSATFTVMGYIAPVITKTTGLAGWEISIFQAMVGLGSIIGIAFGVYVAGKAQRITILISLLGVMAATLGLYSALMYVSFAVWVMKSIILVTITTGAAALFAMMPVLQSWLVERSDVRRQSALALNSAMLFAGQSLGIFIGGFIITWIGLQGLGITGMAISVMSIVILKISATDPQKGVRRMMNSKVK